MSDQPWYSVRCVLALSSDDGWTYEERVTLWRAESVAAAIEAAEREADEYVGGGEWVRLDFAQVFHLFVDEDPLTSGVEVFSLLRDSQLGPGAYLDRHFDSGGEYQGIAEGTAWTGPLRPPTARRAR